MASGGGGATADAAADDAGDSDASDARNTRVSMFCAFQQMPAEPHMCVASYRPDHESLVLLQLRVDGQVQAISNSSEDAWELVRAIV